MLSSPQAEPYRSIFLTDDWAHQKYLGWKVSRDMPGLRILSKQRWAFRRHLVLLGADGVRHLEDALRQLPGPRLLSDVVIHDFNAVMPPAERRIIAGYEFAPADRGQRLLNIATFVVDLGRSLDEIWSDLGTKSRNAARKAEQAGLAFGLASDPSAAIDVFLGQSAEAVSRHSLNYAEKSLLLKMVEGGSLDVLVTQAGTQDPKNVTMIYKSGDAALYMYGSSDRDVPTGLGQYVQWQVIKYLKAQGFRWYDLGGVPSKAPGDPIYKFKESIGGRPVDLGAEFCCQGAGLRLAQRLARFSGRRRRTGAKVASLVPSPRAGAQK